MRLFVLEDDKTTLDKVGDDSYRQRIVYGEVPELLEGVLGRLRAGRHGLPPVGCDDVEELALLGGEAPAVIQVAAAAEPAGCGGLGG